MDMQGLKTTVAIDAGNDTDNKIEVVTDKEGDPCKNPEPDDGTTSAKNILFPSATTTTHFDTGEGEPEIGQYSESDNDAAHTEGTYAHSYRGRRFRDWYRGRYEDYAARSRRS